jgi:N6-adenosine-specific RNA methylase IME4
LERTPDQHYPTLSLDEIKAYRVADKPIRKIAYRDAALLLWCTSSNLHLALDVMAAWDFEFKSSAVWVKAATPDGAALGRFGLGLVFRNMHEILLYGTRGNMPGPQYQPPSVFFYPRGEHSAKPAEIRTEIEKMYPDFDERTRLELFAREQCPGWSRYGFEA